MSDQRQGLDQQLPMSGRVALVAGASKGIGAATAEAFAAAGAAVVLAARDTTALKSVADGIEARGGRALAVGADVTGEHVAQPPGERLHRHPCGSWTMRRTLVIISGPC